jgi:lactate permease
MAVAQYGAAVAGLWNIAAMLGALAGLVVGSIWALIRSSQDWDREELPSLLRTAMLPYVILLVIIFATRFMPPLQATLDVVQVQLEVPEVATTRGWVVPAGTTRSISLFGSTGALLIYASGLIFLLGKRWGALEPAAGQKILSNVVKSGLSSTLGILAMVSLATTMDHAGMITLLAESMADAAGQFFPVISPFIGALGAFVTGSNTNSNVLFGALQRDVAQALGYTVPLILAAQNVGGALGSTFAPAKILVGCSTVGLESGEGQVIRRLLRYDLPALALIALVTLALTLLR